MPPCVVTSLRVWVAWSALVNCASLVNVLFIAAGDVVDVVDIVAVFDDDDSVIMRLTSSLLPWKNGPKSHSAFLARPSCHRQITVIIGKFCLRIFFLSRNLFFSSVWLRSSSFLPVRSSF